MGVLSFLCGELLEVIIKTIEGFFPEFSVMLHPMGHLFEGLCLEAAGAPLGVFVAGDQAGAVEDLEVPGDGGERDVEGPGEVGNGGFTVGEPRENGAAGGVGEGGEGEAERVHCGSSI